MDDWYITCYNLLFTAFPLCVCSLTDIDIKEEDSEECKKKMPLLYKESRDSKRYFTLFDKLTSSFFRFPLYPCDLLASDQIIEIHLN